MVTNEAIGGVIPGALEEALRPRRRRARRLWNTVRQNPLGVFGLAVILALAIVAIFAPLIAPYRVGDISAGAPIENPSWSHFFGTDNIGRDMFSRVVFGARISLAVGLFSVGGGTTIALVLGIISGYMGGVIDSLIQRLVDTALAFPVLLLLLLLAQVLGPSFQTVVLAVGIAIIFPVTRVVRSAVLSERNNQYVEAARALGASTSRILFVHIAPNVAALAIVVGTTLLGTAILAEASLSFLGLGIPVPNPSWGSDVSAARNHFPVDIWWAFFPGAAITLTVLGFNLLGDSLRDILDPRLRGRI
jgi:ABC-type dipeptide/oligopeptide/nickel transport system permease subunit